MAYLGIHTATGYTTLALLHEGQSVCEKQLRNPREADNLVLDIEALCDRVQVDFRSLSALAVTIGPGHYLGIRVGVTTAAMLHHTCQMPVWGVCTLAALVTFPAEGLYLAVLPARKGHYHIRLFRTVWQGPPTTESYVWTPGWTVTPLSAPVVVTASVLHQTLSRFRAPITVCGDIGGLREQDDNPVLRWVPSEVDPLFLAQMAASSLAKGLHGSDLNPYYGYDAV